MLAPKPGSKSKKLLLIGLLILAACGGAVLFGPTLLWGDGVDYSQVSSIRNSGEFQDAALLSKAWALPVAARYGSGNVDYQQNGSFCGPASLVNLMHSLGAPAAQKQILEGSGVSTVFGFLFGGMTLDRVAELARTKTRRNVTVLRNLTLSEFRKHLAQANDLARRYLVNFHRGPLFGKGTGHHSPLAGYLAAEDLVLVIDVNASYKPWLVRSERLYAAIDTIDPGSKQKRGLLLLE